MGKIGYKEFVNTIPVETKTILEYAMSVFKDLEDERVVTSEKSDNNFTEFKELNDNDKAFISLFISLLTINTKAKDVMLDTGVNREILLEFLEKNNSGLILPNVMNRLTDEDKERMYYSNFCFLKTLLEEDGMKEETLTPETLAVLLFDNSLISQIIDKFYIDSYKGIEKKESHPSYLELKSMASDSKSDENIRLKNELFDEFGSFIEGKKSNSIVGREKEIRNLQIALMTPSRKGAVLVGDRGVGKRAIVEGLAYEIKMGNVPDELKDKHVYEINLIGVTAGTKYRGELEEKVMRILELVKNSPDVILFVDNIQEGIKGEEEGHMDFASILSKAISKKEASVIATTTPSAYLSESYFNSSINTLLKKITVEEPEKDVTMEILLSKIPLLEESTSVKFPSGTKKELLIRSIVDITDKSKRGFASAFSNPDLSVILLERAFAIAKINERDILEGDDLIESIQTDEDLSRDARENSAKKLRDALSVQDTLSNGVSNNKIVEFPSKKKLNHN